MNWSLLRSILQNPSLQCTRICTALKINGNRDQGLKSTKKPCSGSNDGEKQTMFFLLLTSEFLNRILYKGTYFPLKSQYVIRVSPFRGKLPLLSDLEKEIFCCWYFRIIQRFFSLFYCKGHDPLTEQHKFGCKWPCGFGKKILKNPWKQ